MNLCVMLKGEETLNPKPTGYPGKAHFSLTSMDTNARHDFQGYKPHDNQLPHFYDQQLWWSTLGQNSRHLLHHYFWTTYFFYYLAMSKCFSFFISFYLTILCCTWILIQLALHQKKRGRKQWKGVTKISMQTKSTQVLNLER